MAAPLVPSLHDRHGHRIPLSEAPDVCRYLRGCVRATVLKHGMVRPERFSGKQAMVLKSRGRKHRARATAGVCLAFTTTGDEVALDVSVLHTLVDSHDGEMAAALTADKDAPAAEKGVMDSLTLEVGGDLTVAEVRSGKAVFKLDNPDRKRLTCHIWLPYLMTVAVGRLRSNGDLEALEPRPLLLTLGDSITQGLVAGVSGETWPVLLARELGCDLLNQGVAGHIFDESTLHGLRRVVEARPAYVVVAYGTNDWSRFQSSKAIAKNARRYLARVKKLFPESRIYVASPLWRADAAIASASGRPLAWVAATLRGLCLRLGLSFVDGLELVDHDPACFGDLRLHPNAKGAAQMADKLAARITDDTVERDGGHLLSKAALEADAESLAREGAPSGHRPMDALVRTIWRLRQPDGCPWDKEQTHASIKRNMVEEAYEAVDAIEADDEAHLREELGDVLMQVLLHAQIAADEGSFTIDDVAAELNEKLVRRHPHVFGDAAARDPDEVLDIWESVKGKERSKTSDGLLDSVPRSLPALMECQKVSKRAARCGFDWDDTAGVWAKFAEERSEFEHEEHESAAAELEFGDLLFTLVNVARKEGIDAEAALRASNAKFRRRWAALEKLCADEGTAPDQLTHPELERLWSLVKKDEKGA